MTARQLPPVHVEVVLPDHVWQRLHLLATARGATVSGVLAEAVVQYLAKERAGDPMDQILDELDQARTRTRIVGDELMAELDALLRLGLSSQEICQQLNRRAGALAAAARRAHRRDLAYRFDALQWELRRGT